jgi:hypothetical protein
MAAATISWPATPSEKASPMGTWESRLREKCTRHKLRNAAHLPVRRQLLPWNIRLISAVSPRWASEITSRVPVRPRSYCCAEALPLAVAHGNAEHFSVAEGFVALGLPRSGCRSPPRRPAKLPACSAPDGRGGRWHRGRRTGSGHGPTAGTGRLSPAHLCPWQMRFTCDLDTSLAPPSASTRASTLRVEIPSVKAQFFPSTTLASQPSIAVLA